MKLEFTPEAISELRDLREYLAELSPYGLANMVQISKGPLIQSLMV